MSLDEYAELNLKNFKPSQVYLIFLFETYHNRVIFTFILNLFIKYNTLNQLIVIRDIACAFTYFHKKTDSKNYSILHGNLQPLVKNCLNYK